VGSINAYNFMDGIDGMAGLQAVVAGIAWGLLGSRFGLEDHAQLGLILAAASAGFLVHNLSKQRIFLGDVGSVFLGFSFAALSVSATIDNPGGPLFFSSALFLWPVLFDTTFTLLRRWRRGEPLTQAHRDHLYQRLVKGGVGHVRVSLVYAVLSILGSAAGSLLLLRSALFAAIALASLMSLALLLWSWVRSVEKRQPQDAVTS
jgi:UDP-N-acetylmuramyl pentapeptide phosphotransferase/UDP-N-acetylglucosamine-1-phosphate transferase